MLHPAHEIKPPRNNPSLYTGNDLEVLNAISTYIHGNDFDPQTKRDALKVIEALKFVKLNIPYLAYAANNPGDSLIYHSSTDQTKGVIRDFNQTSIHIDYKPKDGKIAGEICAEELNNLIQQFEQAYKVCKERNKLKNFISWIKYDGEVGCLNARTVGCLQYALTVSSAVLPNFDELIAQAIDEASLLPPEDQQLAIYRYFALNNFINKEMIYIKKRTHNAASNKFEFDYGQAPLTKQFIDHYLENTLFWDINPNLALPLAKVDAATALKLIADENALVRVLSVPYREARYDEKNWDFNIKQLKDPGHERPVKDRNQRYDRKRVYNPKTRTTITREIAPSRGLPKETSFTKKIACTLLPAHGKMELFSAGKDTLGLLYDIEKCQISEKYIFSRNANTNSRWWLVQQGFRTYNADTLEKVRYYSRTRCPPHNEILARLSQVALRAVFSPNEDFETKLNAIQRKSLIAEQLGIDVPILIITPFKGVKEYAEEEQFRDILACYDRDASEVARAYILLTGDKTLLTSDKFINTLKLASPEEQGKILVMLLGCKLHKQAQQLLLACPNVNKNLRLLHNWNNAKNCSPLHMAVRENQLDIVNMLCEQPNCANAGMEKGKKNPLALAIRMRHYDIAQVIIEKAAHTLSTSQVLSAYSQLVREGKPDLAKLLIKNSLEPTLTSVTDMLQGTGLNLDQANGLEDKKNVLMPAFNDAKAVFDAEVQAIRAQMNAENLNDHTLKQAQELKSRATQFSDITTGLSGLHKNEFSKQKADTIKKTIKAFDYSMLSFDKKAFIKICTFFSAIGGAIGGAASGFFAGTSIGVFVSAPTVLVSGPIIPAFSAGVGGLVGAFVGGTSAGGAAGNISYKMATRGMFKLANNGTNNRLFSFSKAAHDYTDKLEDEAVPSLFNRLVNIVKR